MSAFAASASTGCARAREWLDYPGARYYRKNVQHLMAGKEKEGAESLQIRLWNLNICIEKVNAKCWLAEIWQLSQRGATGRGIRGAIQISETWLQTLLASFSCPVTTAPRRASSQATAISSVVSYTALLGLSQNTPPWHRRVRRICLHDEANNGYMGDYLPLKWSRCPRPFLTS